MGKLKEVLKQKEILFENEEQIQRYNVKTAKVLMLNLSLVFALVFCFSFMSEVTQNGKYSYLLFSALMLIAYLWTNKFAKLKHHLILAYGAMYVFYAFLLYMDVGLTPTEQAGAFIGGICLLPLMFIDKTWRMSLITLSAVVASIVLGYLFKSEKHMAIDAVNSCGFAVGGLVFGYHMNQTRLNGFQLERELVKQRDNDYLTNLHNRRKMFAMFGDVLAGEVERPSCAVMIDIDHFKQYNDTYGHAVGDHFLRCFGKEMLLLEKQYDLKFYRYGGEEISAFMWGYEEEQQKRITEVIRHTVEHMDIEHGRTISIGFVNCTKLPDINMEDALILADAALYQAKGSGRNQVIRYGELHTA